MINSTKSIWTCPDTFYLLRSFICCKYFDSTLLSGAKIQLILFTIVGYLISLAWQVVVSEKEVDEEILKESKDKTEDYRKLKYYQVSYSLLFHEERKCNDYLQELLFW